MKASSRRSLRLAAGLLALAALASPIVPASAAPYTEGNIVIYRAGDGTSPATDIHGAPVYLDEYTTAGVLVQSIAIPPPRPARTVR